MFITLVLIGLISGLCVWSTTKRGIAAVDLAKQHDLFDVPDLQLGISLMWTFFPVLVIQVYILAVAALVNAASGRQPYVELARNNTKHNGAAPQKSILLDYQSNWAICAPFRALRYNHYMLAFSFSTMLWVNVILTALAAHLFFTKTFPIGRPIAVDQPAVFNYFWDRDYMDLTGVLETVAATRGECPAYNPYLRHSRWE